MADTCTYHDRRPHASPICLHPATHLCVCRWDRLGVWDLLAADGGTWPGDRPMRPEFCLDHAMAVSIERRQQWEGATHA